MASMRQGCQQTKPKEVLELEAVGEDPKWESTV